MVKVKLSKRISPEIIFDRFNQKWVGIKYKNGNSRRIYVVDMDFDFAADENKDVQLFYNTSGERNYADNSVELCDLYSIELIKE
ncbi:hypothetical protein O2U01_07325 [Ligilactobacillus salivarius]|uniref:Uncharacterized protein n=1 Tax=Ligilactobacillus salivarius TaxID=1624 RepID=A0ABD7YWY5_9LACO|nr:hypothetical protein [Ligilactobacillus salivarius]WHS06760.1 hypothetical protein O2U07_05635 [Ligilactobacillus salivarius]WHS08835.1 hypothetical protein O2U05_05120 [Ligilactobacillus salivarius]WHS10723.1 hypothetical protein O2U04_03975 [Ligilactobacillus salivarius]WHS14662.1 hypothetical protein O2U03_03180 [Ligilactobacillus salivarius]WHS18438.1 hypothetical protein O2U02_04255 [Ligilactobacillus salivarius]